MSGGGGVLPVTAQDQAKSFQFEGGDEQVLLIHGFTGAPAELRELGEYLHKEGGYTVRCDLLPGHGTKVADLAKTTWHDWYGQARKGYLELAATGRPVHVCGMSMGGTVALHLSTHFRPQSLTVFSAPIFLTDWKLHFLPLIKNFVTAFPKPGWAEDIKDPVARERFVGYNSDPPRGVISLLELIEHVRRDLREICSPTMLMHARQDHRVPYGCMAAIQAGIGESATVDTLTLEDCYHVITVDQEKQTVFERTLAHIRANSGSQVDARALDRSAGR